ncbi:MAG: tRNA glutamyl-Q(34) synthetase GluQRS [Planctomycetales bacterium]|nr:tRNA glutamyl-Q(34) synthetase GluQRS [Planctomycetales bacterium]
MPPQTPAPFSPVVGRLAPSPTGAQHIGNARTYLLAWLSIRSRSGKVILRVEDIDSPRIKPGASQQAMDDLGWLGLNWDEGPDKGGPQTPYVQTQRLRHYRDALEQLKAAEQVYPCTCSRTDVAAAASAPHIGQEGPRYPGTCSSRHAADAEELTKRGRTFSWRFRASDTHHKLHDRIVGIRTCNVSEELGDFVVAKSDGSPAYQLAVVVDDLAMGVTEVLRGDDLLPSTFRQLELFQFFQARPPAFAHVPLVIGEDGRRLAKRHGDTRISMLREANVPAARLVGFLAWSAGLRPTPEPLIPQGLLADFQLDKVSREPFVFTAEMLRQLLG